MKNKQNQSNKNKKRKNKQSKALKLECKDCGAALKIVTKGHALCPYCGQRYLIDEGQGLIVDVNVTYGNTTKTRSTLWSVIWILIAFFAFAALIVYAIWEQNVPARESRLAASKEEGIVSDDILIQIFCEDIFDKEFQDITKEELESIRYIRWEYNVDGPGYAEVYYSLVDYKDCANEEEFQETIKYWTYSGVRWPKNFTMLTGLTRIDTYNTLGTAIIELPKKADITYVRVDEKLTEIRNSIDPKKVEVLHLYLMDESYLEGIEEYTNVKELYINGSVIDYFNEEQELFDMNMLSSCKKLERLTLDTVADGYQNLELLAEMPQLKDIYISGLTLSEADFLQNMPQLEVLTIRGGENPDCSIFKKLPNLKELNFLDYVLMSAEEILELKKIEKLNIMVEDEEALQVFSKLPNLKKLSLRTDIQPSESYGEWQVLDVSVLSECPKLEYLSLELGFHYHRAYVGVEAFLNYSTLKGLSLDVSLVDQTKLSQNTTMESLNLSELALRDMVTGESIPVEKILDNYPNIQRVYLEECGLEDISYLAKYENLRFCDLQGNEITDFSPLQACRKLEEVWIWDNPYEEVSLSEEVKVIEYWQ